jgi:hypothetical protein
MGLGKNVLGAMTRDTSFLQVFFSISLNETTDIILKARPAIIARYFDGIIMRDELVILESLPVSTSGKEIFRVVKDVFENLKIDISKIVSI